MHCVWIIFNESSQTAGGKSAQEPLDTSCVCSSGYCTGSLTHLHQQPAPEGQPAPVFAAAVAAAAAAGVRDRVGWTAGKSLGGVMMVQASRRSC
jgi:hypothetical protein